MGVTITAIVGVFIYIVNFTTRSFQKTLNFQAQRIFTGLLISLAGALKGYLLYFSIDLGGFIQPTNLLARIISSVATELFWLTLCSLIIEDARIFRRRFTSVLRASILKLAQGNPNAGLNLLPMEMQSEIKVIETMLSRNLDAATSSVMDRNALIIAAQQVRNTVEEKIRPLSHRLWLRSNTELPQVKIGATLRASIKEVNVPPISTAGFLTLTTIFNLSASYGWIRGMYAAIFLFLTLYTYFEFLAPKVRVLCRSKIISGLVNALTPGLLLSIYFYLSNRYLFKDDSGIMTFTYVPIIFLAVVFVSTYQLAQSDRNRVLQLIEENLLGDLGDSTRHGDVVAGNVASYLHNSLQSELIALSYQIEESAKNPDSEESRALLERLGSRINRSISQDFEDFIEKPLDRLSKLESAWKGIAHVDIQISPQYLEDPASNFLIVQIIEEAVSNAVRHSHAKDIQIKAQDIDGHHLLLEISNDGAGQPSESTGLGTDWLDRYAAGKWSRTFSDKGTVLQIIL